MNGEGIDVKKMGGIGRFKVAGIWISFDVSWFLVFAVVLFALSEGFFPSQFPGYQTQTYWLAGLIATLLFFTSVVIHELAHSLVAVRAGMEIQEITLFIFGGVSKITEEPRDPATEFKMAVVGPLASFALALGFWVIMSFFKSFDLPLVTGVFAYLAWINLALGAFNLIPGFPIDGGRLFRAIYWWKTGSLTRATKVAADLGKGFAVALMVLGGLQIFLGDLIGGLWFIFIGMFLRGMSQRGYEEVVTRKSLEDVPVREVMTTEVVSVPPDLPLTRLVHDYFLHYAYHGFPVAQNAEVLGVVSLARVRGVPPEEQPVTTVKEFMIPRSPALEIDPESTLTEAMQQMAREDQDRLLVVDQGQMVGILTRSTLQRFIDIKRVLEPE